MTKFDAIKERVERLKHSQNYENEAQVDREYLMDMIGLQQQALELALPEMNYDERFKAVHEQIVRVLRVLMHVDDMDPTELANVLTAKALQALDAKMEAPYE